jgi:hypothetical protein
VNLGANKRIGRRTVVNFRLSRSLFVEHDVRNIGKRLLAKIVCEASCDPLLPVLEFPHGNYQNRR